MTVFDLFVREDGLVDWTPPLIRLFLVGEAGFEKLEETPLGPAVVFGVGSVYFPAPIYCEAKAFELGTEVVDVGFGGVFGRGAGFNGIVFGGETKGVVAEGAQDVHALLGVEAGESVDDGKIADVTDVEAGAGGIGEHFGDKEFFFFSVFVVGLKGGGVLPDFLPFLFNRKRVITIHRGRLYHI